MNGPGNMNKPKYALSALPEEGKTEKPNRRS
jgi:hypothetical protein